MNFFFFGMTRFISDYKWFLIIINRIPYWSFGIVIKKQRQLLSKSLDRKAHKDFPRKYLESTSCGWGFWATDGSGHYSHQGILAEAQVDSEVIVPS